MSAIIHTLNNSTRGESEQYQQMLEKITQCLDSELSELMGNLFNGADDMLFQLAENADSNEDQAEHFDTMRQLRLAREHLSDDFAQHLRSLLDLPAIDDSEDELTFDEDELSLVDQSEMEEMVAITTMHSKAMNLYGDAVNHLQARIEFLSMKTRVFDKDALSPKNICESFKQALSNIELPIKTKLLLYKLFDQEVIVKLQPMYKKLNQIFIDRGILPQIKLGESTQKNQSPSTASPAASTTSVDSTVQEAMFTDNMTSTTGQANAFNHHQFTTSPVVNTSTGTQQEINRVIHQFISGEATASGPGIPSSFTRAAPRQSSGANQYYDRREVLEALSNIQANVAHSDNGQVIYTSADYKRALIEDMSRRSGGAVTRQVNQVDEKTIDFIEMLFDAIVEDTSISEAVTNLILRLQIPVIKVAMLDQNFFADGNHDARITLNLIAYLGRGINSREDALFGEIESVVEYLLDDFQADVRSFQEANDQLEQIEQKELEAAEVKEKETQREVLQKHAREIVLTELQYLVKGKVLPKPCQKLLLKHWSTFMFHTYIKQGKTSEQWIESVRVARNFITLVQPIGSTQAFHATQSARDDVLDSMQGTLLETRQNPVEIETEINNTFVTIESMLESSRFNPDNLPASETYFTDMSDDDELDSMFEPELDASIIEEVTEQAVDPLEEQSQLAREKIARLPADVRPGVWFEVFTGEDTALRRTKLSVIIMEEAKLVFVDRVGVKVIEKDADEFTNEIADGKSSIISDHSAFDHALGMVINSLSRAN